MSTKKPREFRYSKTVRVWTIVGSSVLAVFGVLCITLYTLVALGFSKISFTGDGPVNPNADVNIEKDEDELDNGISVNDEEYLKAQSVLKLPLRGNEKGVRNILLVGVDSRKNDFSGLSDTTIILSINDNTKTIKLISLLRDTWVSIPGRDKDGDGVDDTCKLNTAYAYGRHTLQRKMIAQNFRLDIDDYIGVNFQVLPILIDAMGGLDIELTAKEITQIPALGCKISVRNEGFIQMQGKPGVHHLDGFQSMEYARIRKIDSDFKRTERQRHVLTLLIEKAKKMSYSDLLSVVYKAVSHVDTNMSSDEFIEFAANAMKYASYTIENKYHIPGDKGYLYTSLPGKGSGLLLKDHKQTVIDLHQYIYE